MNMLHKFREATYAYNNLYLQKKSPVIVYAPGRVGSMGLIKNLREADIFSFKVESFASESRDAAFFCRKHILERGRAAKIITLVRDPLDIMTSYFMSKSDKGWIPGSQEALYNGDTCTMQKIFISEVLQTPRLDHHLFWYENEFIKNLELDIFTHPFDTKEKYSLIENIRFPTLVLRTELDDNKKQSLVNSFLNTNNVLITRENTQQQKKFYQTYLAFKKNLSVPQQALERIYTAPYVTHFFSPEEIKELVAKWS